MLESWIASLSVGRRAAHIAGATVALLQPFLRASERRYRKIPTEIWRHNMPLGFLTTIATLEYQRRTPGAAQNQATIALVQLATYQGVSGHSPDGIGQLIQDLSLSNDSQFLAGCAQGKAFHTAVTDAVHNASACQPIEATPGRIGKAAHLNDTALAEWAGTSSVEIWTAMIDPWIESE